MKMKIQHENMWDTAKIAPRVKFIAVRENVRKEGDP